MVNYNDTLIVLRYLLAQIFHPDARLDRYIDDIIYDISHFYIF